MQSLRLTVRHTESTIHPIHRAVCESPDIDRERLLQGNTTGERNTLLFHVEGDRQAYASALEETDAIVDYDIVALRDGFYAYLQEVPRDPDEALYAAFSLDSLVVVPPVVFRSDRTMRTTVLGDHDQLRSMLTALPEGMSVDIERVGTYRDDPAVELTGRQRDVLAAALDAGYYEVPREGSLSAVAERLSLAESTVSAHLRKAEARLVERALGKTDSTCGSEGVTQR